MCTGATAFTNNLGKTYIIIINEALWFGDQMPHSLINPYQLRAYGITVVDDPTDPNWDMMIEAQETKSHSQ